MNKSLHDTQFFRIVQENKMGVDQMLDLVYTTLSRRGYNPVNQIVGCVVSGDPTCIMSHRNVRSLITKAERDDILELLPNYCIRHKIDRH